MNARKGIRNPTNDDSRFLPATYKPISSSCFTAGSFLQKGGKVNATLYLTAHFHLKLKRRKLLLTLHNREIIFLDSFFLFCFLDIFEHQIHRYVSEWLFKDKIKSADGTPSADGGRQKSEAD